MSRFTKNRNAPDDQVPSLEWRFTPTADGRVEVKTDTADSLAAFRQCLEDGLDSATDIAEEMGLSKGQVSKLATKAIQEGWAKKDGRHYALVDDPDLVSRRRP